MGANVESELPMLKLVFGMMVLLTQLSGPEGGLPQILQPAFKPTTPIKAGRRGEVAVSFTALKGYAIDRTLPMTLKLNAVPGITLAKAEIAASSNDPKAKDQYYVDLPVIKVPVTAAKPGKYEVPGKLTYFFCSKADGFCSRQILDVKMPVAAE
jgi:hypothetical protein